MNQHYLGVFAFLLTGLIWSGGHSAWLITLGIFVTLGFIAQVAIIYADRVRQAAGG